MQILVHKRSNIEEPPCNNRCKNVDRIERGQLVFIPSRIRVGGWSERNIVVGTTLAPVYFPTIFTTVPVSVALPSPRGDFPSVLVDVVWSREGSYPVVVGVSDSGTTRLLPSYRLLLFINGELVSPSFTFTYARLAITLNDARAISWGEEKQTLRTSDSKGDQPGIQPVAFLDDG